MSRRTRGLFLTMCSLHGWDALQGDVSAAFLQGMESEEERMIFSKPVRELAEALGGKEGDHVQIIKACYGLAKPPSQWFNSVCQTMQECRVAGNWSMNAKKINPRLVSWWRTLMIFCLVEMLTMTNGGRL